MDRGEKQCLRCGGSMEEGFIGDHTYGGVTQSTWFEGRATNEHGFGLRVEHRGRRPVETHQCRTCGFLEHYAPEYPLNDNPT